MEEQKQLIDVMNMAIANALANVHTATIAKVTAITGATISCKPVINRVVKGESIELPEFIDVPVVTLHGGSSYIALPVAPGDYALLIFTERCFDRWWIGQDFKSPLQMRMHDYSDGFALVGVKPLAGGIPIPTTTTVNGPVNLGSPLPTDAVALASKVLAELGKIAADLAALKAAIGTAATTESGADGIGGMNALNAAIAAWPTYLTPDPTVASLVVKAD